MCRWNYNSDDESASPGLEPVIPRWGPPSQSPPPRTQLNSQEDPSSTSRSATTITTSTTTSTSSHPPPRRPKFQPSQGDVVLLNFLAPNRPDIASEAGKRALISDEEGSDKAEEEEVMSDTAQQLQVTSGDDLTVAATQEHHPLSPPPSNHPTSTTTLSSTALSLPPNAWRSTDATAPSSSSMAAVASRPYESHANAPTHAQMSARPDYGYAAENASPSPPSEKLTHERSSSRDSNRPNDIKLPPVSTLLDAANQDPRSSHSQHRPHGADSASSVSPTGRAPGPYGYASPVYGQQTQPYYAAAPSRTPQTNSPPANYFAQSPGMAHSAGPYPAAYGGSYGRYPPGHPTPASSTETSYPTPSNDTPIDRQASTGAESLPSAASGSAYANGGFKCTFDGCTAVPFQTQYLLNSHANVHSQNRPHFCPVEGCPRAEGGKGFKRKNEMIRHGLVHQSPGYTCPFCPDREHKYPRPDNLQRHVKMHHSDKDKDDPALRTVLSQRPTGSSSTRGRRRRGT